MATVTHDSSVSAKGINVSTLSVSLTIANNSNRYVIGHACADTAAGPAQITSMTWNTTETMAALWSQLQLLVRTRAFGLAAPTATTANIACTFGATEEAVAVSGSSFYNVHQTTSTGTARTSSGTSGNNFWIGVDGGVTNGLVVGCGAWDKTTIGNPAISDKTGLLEFWASGALSTATAQTSRTPALPANSQRGDIVLAHCASENNNTHACSTSGWNNLGQTNSGTGWTVSYWWAIEDGALGAPVITWTDSNDASAHTHSFRDTKVSTPCAYIGTVGTGTGGTHTSTGGNSTENNVRVAYIDHANANTALATPAGWTEHTDSGSATGPCQTTLGSIAIATLGTGSGNISVLGALAAWVQQQIEIYRHAITQVAMTEQEDIGDFAAFAVSYETSSTYNTLGWTGTGTTASYVTGAIELKPTAAAATSQQQLMMLGVS